MSMIHLKLIFINSLNKRSRFILGGHSITFDFSDTILEKTFCIELPSRLC